MLGYRVESRNQSGREESEVLSSDYLEIQSDDLGIGKNGRLASRSPREVGATSM